MTSLASARPVALPLQAAGNAEGVEKVEAHKQLDRVRRSLSRHRRHSEELQKDKAGGSLAVIVAQALPPPFPRHH